MRLAALDVDAVRARFGALGATSALFDAPGGTQVPDSVVNAIAGYLRDSNANLGGAFGSSRRTDALLTQARLAAAAFLRCEPDEAFFGAHLGLGFVRRELAERWRPYKVRPADHPFETGTLPHELLAGFIGCVEYLESIGWSAIQQHERALGQQFLDGLPASATLYGPP